MTIKALHEWSTPSRFRLECKASVQAQLHILLLLNYLKVCDEIFCRALLWRSPLHVKSFPAEPLGKFPSPAQLFTVHHEFCSCDKQDLTWCKHTKLSYSPTVFTVTSNLCIFQIYSTTSISI